MKQLLLRALTFCQEHRIALLLALLAGFISVLPHLLAVFALGNSYQGIPFLYADNEDYYLARIHEITDGHGFVASPFFYEYKNAIPLVPPIGEYFYVVLKGLTGFTLPHTLVLAKFLFPAILFFLIYYLIRALVYDETPRLAILSGIAGGIFVTVGLGLTDYLGLYSRFIGDSFWPVLSMWTRPVNPITGALLLFPFLILLWKMKTNGTVMLSAVAGVLLVAMAGYIFSFGVGLAVLASILVLAAFFRNYEEVKRYSITAGIALVLIASYALLALPAAGEGSLARNGLLLGHAPLLNKITLLAVALTLAAFFYAYRVQGCRLVRDEKRYSALWFCLALLIASFAALNQQVITGISIWPYHLVQYTVPLAIVALVVVGTIVIGAVYPRAWKTFLFFIIAVSILFGAWNATTYTRVIEDFRSRQNYVPLFTWLEEHAKDDCVVLVVEDSPETLTDLIPGFTKCNIYATPYTTGNVPEERILHNYLLQLRLRGVDPAHIEEYLESNQAELLPHFYADWIELFSLADNPRIKALIPELSTRYREFALKNLESELHKYRIDYLLDAGPLSPDMLSVLSARKVFESGAASVYVLR